MSIFHVHYDRNWQMDGPNALHECRCGARRTRWIYWGMLKVVPPPWPPLIDRHGDFVRDTGWVKP